MSVPPYHPSVSLGPISTTPYGRPQRVATPVWRSLRDLRQHHKLSLRRLAEQAGTNAGYLSQLETGQRLPSPAVLAGLFRRRSMSTRPGGVSASCSEHEETA